MGVLVLVVVGVVEVGSAARFEIQWAARTTTLVLRFAYVTLAIILSKPREHRQHIDHQKRRMDSIQQEGLRGLENPRWDEPSMTPGDLRCRKASLERQLFVFGSNGECQLGVPAADIVDTPTRVMNPPKLEGMRNIQGGDNHTIILTDQKDVYCAGDNRKGQVMPYKREDEPRIETLRWQGRGPSSIAATCESSAFVTAGPGNIQSHVSTQGHGHWGELGLGELVKHIGYNPENSVNYLPSKAIDLAAGVWHYVAVLEDGSVYGWGKARQGQLGKTQESKINCPTELEGISFNSVRVTCGKEFTYLAGDPTTGEHIVLGNDKFNIVSGMPPDIVGWKDIGATWHAIFVLFEDGKLAAWGRNTMWKLIPPDLPPIQKIAIGSEHVLAVTKEGKLISWGWGKHGNCGNLSNMQDKVRNDMVSGFWNEIDLPGEVEFVGAGYCTSFVITKM